MCVCHLAITMMTATLEASTAPYAHRNRAPVLVFQGSLAGRCSEDTGVLQNTMFLGEGLRALMPRGNTQGVIPICLKGSFFLPL